MWTLRFCVSADISLFLLHKVAIAKASMLLSPTRFNTEEMTGL
jgi:hypothetical protein